MKSKIVLVREKRLELKKDHLSIMVGKLIFQKGIKKSGKKSMEAREEKWNQNGKTYYILKMGIIKKAKEFAKECHKGQFRYDGKTPYIKHPEAVVNLLLKAKIGDEIIIASAWLHDVVEDCDIQINKIQKEFGEDIAKIVNTLTRNVDREQYKQRIKESDFAVKIIKLADTIHNCSEMYQSSVPEIIRTTKINDCNNFYFELAKQTFEPFYFLLKENIK